MLQYMTIRMLNNLNRHDSHVSICFIVIVTFQSYRHVVRSLLVTLRKWFFSASGVWHIAMVSSPYPSDCPTVALAAMKCAGHGKVYWASAAVQWDTRLDSMHAATEWWGLAGPKAWCLGKSMVECPALIHDVQMETITQWRSKIG